ncbi:(myosin heavy-chain) kinase : WD40 repeat-containing protein OS=Haliscomenobacter hydrossis (strain ATCC 27775 / DSM 1100 / LMG 10767 / O) GN=Halhy_6675 PE=4 SV=1: WD40: WD40: WD40 [Gemmataceae bacterium]|nr:(myosin heavy-chain) kinase : WD40 repeat-containing protein OS=Haliscomenobacter hydrossis (strain ATCC 27775 / DSM 1100 / LMG 10767 / O) GN=Halhy_6675 PE=4 SV=1: WD40: WD40: WD40 [Gemmataceae bacterium]VTU01420.1 (myosin heavy-chain) kinase : WD40 repeat-containing protein OS=Haliscomenobacter hydrossis (strain ATCC 27775 / DSM 1100 / LMG 10767 / O) GN=Halhy_6675 PE=4 SV=1: WD40: WD40: WD40 [Gemmataceae bacterium]
MRERTVSPLVASLLLFLSIGDPCRTAEPPTLTKPAEVLALKGHIRPISSIAFTPDGSKVVTGSTDGTARVWDAKTGKELLKFDSGHFSIAMAAVTPDGQRVAVAQRDAAKNAGTVRVWDLKSGKQALSIDADVQKVFNVAYSPDGAKLATAGTNGGVFKDGGRAVIWDATGKELVVLKGHDGVVLSVEFSSDGTRLLTLDESSYVRVWDVKSGEQLLKYRPPSWYNHSCAFSPDGAHFVAGGMKDVQVVDAKTGDVVQTFKGHARPVSYVAFSPCGTRLVTSCWDGVGRVWDVKTGKELFVLAAPANHNLRPLAFTPDGTRIAAGTGGDLPGGGYRIVLTIWEIATPNKVP